MEKEIGYNPDILSCLANLSNDEVFTPPEVANALLDMIPESFWLNPNVRVLDPCTKSGVFLREAAKRFIKGLEKQIPDLQERIDHIFHKQLYGIAITELTGYLSRRSLYCSKNAHSDYSVTGFKSESGNIVYNNIKHTWVGENCKYCGASKSEYNRSKDLEQHAYEFIHLSEKKLKELQNVHFDLIIGNPPYQLADGGGDGNSAMPIYQKFVEMAKKLAPSYISMIIPARWYAGGKGLDDFRFDMLHDNRLAIIHDFPETSDCFPGLNIRGGVCYFLWNKNHHDSCTVYNHKQESVSKDSRPLLENNTDTFIRYNEAISILRKVRALGEATMDSRVSSRLPFGIPSNFADYSTKETSDASVILYRSERGGKLSAQKKVYVSPKYILKNIKWKDSMKVLVSKASPGGDEYPHSIITTPILAEKNSVCTETYLIVDFVKDEIEGKNLISYMSTKFFRFMMALIKNTQNISKGVFAFVPVQDFSKAWTDKQLYEKYGINESEIAFIDSMIRPMEF